MNYAQTYRVYPGIHCNIGLLRNVFRIFTLILDVCPKRIEQTICGLKMSTAFHAIDFQFSSKFMKWDDVDIDEVVEQRKV